MFANGLSAHSRIGVSSKNYGSRPGPM